MLFVEAGFFQFFVIVFTVFWLTKNETLRRSWLTLAGFFFYGCFFIGPPLHFVTTLMHRQWAELPRGWWFPAFLLASMALDYGVGLGLGAATTQARRRTWLLASLLANLGVLGTFKYGAFTLNSGEAFLRWLGFNPHWPALHLILPVGISFYTFQSLSYSLEVYRGHLRPVRRFLDLAFFISFFPQLVAGPIVRATAFLPQLVTPRRWADVKVRAAAILFFTGFVKKSVVAEHAAPLVDAFFGNPGEWSASATWLAALAYAVQIYADFSGYSDMARAVAMMFGYELPLNFDFPYLAASLRDFWRRWHISLSTWLRDYLYISLGGNRGSGARTVFNLMATMTIGGLWHGASWTFVVWGMLHGAGLVVHRWWEKGFGVKFRQAGTVWTVAAWALTFLWVVITWVFFRAPSFGVAGQVVAQLFTGSHGSKAFAGTAWVFAVGLFALHAAGRAGWWRRIVDRLPDAALAAVLGTGWALALYFTPVSYRPFIYFQF